MIKNLLGPNASNNARRVGDGGQASPIVARCRLLDSHVFVHTHIEKTAGSALVQGMAALVGWAHTMDVRAESSVHAAAMTSQERALIRLYSGHFNYGVHKHFAQKPLYIAAVRPPVDRAVSYYRYCVERTGHPNHKIFVDKDFSAAFDYMDKTDHAVARNGQVQRVMGAGYSDSVSDDDVIGHVRNAYFAVVPQHRVDAFVNAIRIALDLPPVALPEFNVGKGPSVDLAPRLRSRVNRANTADLALVKHARRSFKETLEHVKDYVAENCRRAAA